MELVISKESFAEKDWTNPFAAQENRKTENFTSCSSKHVTGWHLKLENLG